MSCLCKQCRSRSAGFWRCQLIWIYTVCQSVCEFMSAIWIKKPDWQTIGNVHGILSHSAWQGLILWWGTSIEYPRFHGEIRKNIFQIHLFSGAIKLWYFLFTFDWLLGFNNTSTLVCHFVLSPREREKSDRRDSRREEREGQGWKRNRNESEETEEIKTFPLYPYLLQGQQALPNSKPISVESPGDIRYTTPSHHHFFSHLHQNMSYGYSFTLPHWGVQLESIKFMSKIFLWNIHSSYLKL